VLSSRGAPAPSAAPPSAWSCASRRGLPLSRPARALRCESAAGARSDREEAFMWPRN